MAKARAKRLSVPAEQSREEMADLLRRIHLSDWKKGHASTITAITAVPRRGELPNPIVSGLGDRSSIRPAWSPRRRIQAKDLNSSTLPKSAAAMKRKLQEEDDFLNSTFGLRGPVRPEYDLLEPYTILDTESYLQQAVRRRHSLMFRNGFAVSGDDPKRREYIQKRFVQLGYMTEQTVGNFFKEILWNLLVCSNCVVVKVRDENASGGFRNRKNDNRIPVAGYKIVPIHTIFPVLDGEGNIQKWRRYFTSKTPVRHKDYPLQDIIHFYWDRKPGHIFGTPRTTAVRDDILALRRLEENTELLFVHHLFPLVHVKVGTKEAPAVYNADGSSEIDFVRFQIENMPKEGVFITDERVSVDVAGASGESLDPSKLLDHYKNRVFTGLGVSGIDMGEMASGNRSTAENVSQNLKDTVKADLAWFCEQVQMSIIRELFQEHQDETLSVQNAIAEVCLEFHEIDVDGMIKMENHAMNLYNNHLITETESRRRIKSRPLSNQERRETHFEQHVLRLARETARAKATASGKSASGKADVPRTANAPANQHGRNTDPHKARSSSELTAMLIDQLRMRKNEMEQGQPLSRGDRLKIVDEVLDWYTGEVLGNYYTSQARAAVPLLREQLANLVAETEDIDVLSVLLQEVEIPAALTPGAERSHASAEDARLPDDSSQERGEQEDAVRV